MVTPEQYGRLKYIKNTSSFWRNCFNFIINIYKQRLFNVAEGELKFRLKMSPDKGLKKGSESMQIFDALVNVRKQRRISNMEVIHSIIRLVMLWWSLKLPKYNRLNGIFVVVLGNISVWISLLKFGLKDSKEGKSKKKSSSTAVDRLKIGRTESKRELLRSMSSVFNNMSDNVSRASNSEEDLVLSLQNQGTLSR